METKFNSSRVVIIQSLEPQETKTGWNLRGYIAGNEAFRRSGSSVEFMTCEYADEFLELINILIQDATKGSVSVLHVECHGDPVSGLEFSNGSNLSWKDVATALARLNVASHFNLLTTFSACFGVYFISQMNVICPAPCYRMVAPTHKVDPGEIFAGFMLFYRTWFETGDLDGAINALVKIQLEKGSWHAVRAEEWFEKLVTGYVKNCCGNQMALLRANSIRLEMLALGKALSIESILSILRDRNRDKLVNCYFEEYFMTSELPTNVDRFKGVKNLVDNHLTVLRDTGHYVV
jgi:hypothetical protein